MKREWVSPVIAMQQFIPNEYVSACGDQNMVYKFKCEAGGGKSGDVYLETNGTAGLQTSLWGEWGGGDRSLGGYHACGVEHEASTTDDFLEGYYVVGSTVTPVIVWRGPRGTNTHCTTNLDMNSWETAKS